MESMNVFGFEGTTLPLSQIAGRLIVAMLLGGVIGLERELRNHSAGLRTHMLTALAAATFTVMTFEIYHQMIDLGSDLARLDPIRVIEAVTAGVAFLAAGAIIRSGGNIKGLTTGAGMWMAGAIGVACGAGFYVVAAIGAVLVLVITGVLGLVEKRMLKDKADD